MARFSFLRKRSGTDYKPVQADDFAGLEHDGVDQHEQPSRLSKNWPEARYSTDIGSEPTDPDRGKETQHAYSNMKTGASLTLQLGEDTLSSNMSEMEGSTDMMSLGMNIETELKKLREEQKKADTTRSRRSSLRNSIQNSRPTSQVSSRLHFHDLPSPSAYIPISNESPFAASSVRSRPGSIAAGPHFQAAGNVETHSQSSEPTSVSRRSSNNALQSPALALQTAFEDGSGGKPKELTRGLSKTSDAPSESLYSPDGGARMRRDNSQAYSESIYSSVKSPVDQASKPLPLNTAFGRIISPSRRASASIKSPKRVGDALSPTANAPEPVAELLSYADVASPSNYAPEVASYQAYRPGGIQLIQDQPNPNGSYANAFPRRRCSAGSMDTYQQAATAFQDFDGAHVKHHEGHADDERPAEVIPRGRKTKRRSENISTIDGSRSRSRLSQLTAATRLDDDKHALFLPDTEAPKRQSMLSLAPELDSKRRSTITLGPVRPQTPPEGHVFYPAPIPAVLTLPSKISRGPNAADVLRKQEQYMASVRKSALQTGMFEPGGGDPRASAADLDPHLKASLYFDHRPANYELKLLDGSASKTLEAILEAAATAPLGAFTDHPYAGVLGPEVYGPSESPRKPGQASRTSASNLLAADNRRNRLETASRSASGSALTAAFSEGDAAIASSEGTPLSRPDEGEEGYFEEDAAGEDAGPEANDFQGEHPDYIPINAARPTTLLAELQLRKAENKHRTRTAATAFPNGMHSTLLQLDAVAQHQARARRGKQVRLAWEDPDALGREEDEDVPLGMLLPNAQRPNGTLLPPVPQANSASNEDVSRPQSAEVEETLGQRKARLALEAEKKRLTLTLGELDDGQQEEEGESLAARRSRLHRRNSSEFTSELMSQIGALAGEETEKPAESQSTPGKRSQPARRKSRQSFGSISALAALKQPEGEETLGQRRRRLQAQQATKDDAARLQERVKSRTSSMDLLAGEPGPTFTGSQAAPSLGSFGMMFPNGPQVLPQSHAPQQYAHSPAMQTQMQTTPSLLPGVMPAMAFGFAPPPMPVPAHQQMSAHSPGQPAQPLGLLGAHMLQQQQSRNSPNTNSMPQMSLQQMQAMQAMNPGRRDMVDRWRQGIA